MLKTDKKLGKFDQCSQSMRSLGYVTLVIHIPRRLWKAIGLTVWLVNKEPDGCVNASTVVDLQPPTKPQEKLHESHIT